jgi:hypothetical protein
MPRYRASISVNLDAPDELTARHLAGLFIAEGTASMQYEGHLQPGQVFAVTVRKVEERAIRTKRCPDCHGAGHVRGSAGYPGTGANRPLVDCRSCEGSGRVEVLP